MVTSLVPASHAPTGPAGVVLNRNAGRVHREDGVGDGVDGGVEAPLSGQRGRLSRVEVGVALRRPPVEVWPLDAGQHGRLSFDLSRDRPLIHSAATSPNGSASFRPIAKGLDPMVQVRIGDRDLEKRGNWTVFFDRMQSKPSEVFRAKIEQTRAIVTSNARRATLTIGDVSAGPFQGQLRWTFYAGSSFVLQEAVMKTERDPCRFWWFPQNPPLVPEMGSNDSVPAWAEMLPGTGWGRAQRKWFQESDAQDRAEVAPGTRVQFSFAKGFKSVGFPILRGNLHLSERDNSDNLAIHPGNQRLILLSGPR